MKSNTILIIGGYGGTGKVVCKWLLKETFVKIIIAGPHLNKAEELRDQLNKDFSGHRGSAVFADASDYQSLITAFKND